MAIDETNGKATIREVYDLVKPMVERQIKIETTLDNFIGTYEKGHKEIQDEIFTVCKSNKEEHDDFKRWILGKISIKAFASWLSAAVIVISAILGYLKFLKIM